MADALRVNNIHFGNVASNHNQAHIGFTSVGIGSTANYGALQFVGVPNTLCWTANGTVGIGVTAPSTAFHVNGDITASRIIANSYSATDDRSISPSEIPTNSVKPFFSSWDNNSGGFYADAIGFNTYTDGSGGNSNLLMIYKNGFGIRQYQAAFGSATRFSSYKDVQMVESNGDVNIDGRELRISQMSSGQCQFRIKSGNTNISSMFHCNGTDLYFLCSDNGNWQSGYNTLRPLYMSLTTGIVTMAHGLNVSGTVSASNISTTTYNGTNMRFVKVGNDDSPNGGVGYNAGYVVLVGGLCIQWGMKSSQNGNNQWPSYINFPIAFTTVYICMGCSGYGAASGPANLSNTGCYFSAGGNTVTYIAIGYYNG